MQSADLCDPKQFTNVVYQYDKRNGKLDDLVATLLLHIKRAIKGEYEPKLAFEDSSVTVAADGSIEYNMQSDLTSTKKNPAPTATATASASATGTSTATAAGGVVSPKTNQLLIAKANAFANNYATAAPSTAATATTAALPPAPVSAPAPIITPKSGDRKAPPPPIPAKPTLPIQHRPTNSIGSGSVPASLSFPHVLPTIEHDPTSPSTLDSRDSKAHTPTMSDEQRTELDSMYKRASPLYNSHVSATAGAPSGDQKSSASADEPNLQ
jgi:hypothetical protein